jgi:hypothetical protein
MSLLGQSKKAKGQALLYQSGTCFFLYFWIDMKGFEPMQSFYLIHSKNKR